MSVRGLTTIAAIAAGLALAGAAPATSVLPAQKGALDAVRLAAKAGHLDSASAARDRAEINRAAHLIRGLPNGRGYHVGVALGEVAAFAGKLTAPRALALFGQLKANDDYFAVHWAPPDKTDITDADGVVYRYFGGRCFEFHPLANFGALNAHVAAGDVAGTKLLADALTARGIYQRSGGIAWEYYFPFGGGRAPWISGMAQAVAAQSLARAATLVTDESTGLMKEATAAYRLIPKHLLTSVAAGPWIKLYAFQSTPVLNAQLQAVLSLTSYAVDAKDASAAALAHRMQNAAAATLARFDTGYWTYYSLPHEPSPPDYQQFVVQLLKKLSPADPRFADAATRFAGYETQPPAFKLATAGVGALRFWLSKPSSVQVVSAAGPAKHLALGDGWHTLTWQEPKRAGTYSIKVSAVDWAGNHASFESLPIVRVTATGSKANTTRRTSATTVAAQPAFTVGAGLDDPSQAAQANALGLRLVRLGVAWPAGAVAPDPAIVSALQAIPAGTAAMVELAASPLPTDDAGVTALSQYAASLAQQVPALRDLVLTPAPTPYNSSAYVAAFDAARSAVQAVVPTVAVGPSINGAVAPRGTVTALGRAFAATGAAAPYADLVAFRPAPAPVTAQWTTANVPTLATALANALGGTAPPVIVDGIAIPSAIPSTELGSYPAEQTQDPAAVSATAQADAYAGAITSAACSPSVAGVVLDRLTDSAAAPAPTTGVFYPSGNAKPAAAAVTAATGPAQRGIVICPGLAASAGASTLTFPDRISSSAGTSVVLGCTRDCLYLVTLDAADGHPVVARRGALRGGAAPITVGLPKAALTSGAAYRLDVRLAAQVNPGPVTQLLSSPLTAG